MNAPRHRSRRSPGWLLAATFVIPVMTGACSRAHLTSTHGRAFHEVFTAQDANPNRSTTKSVHGLDSQEAAIISGSYRHALAPQGAPAPQSQQLLTTNAAAASGAAVPASSVPGN